MLFLFPSKASELSKDYVTVSQQYTEKTWRNRGLHHKMTLELVHYGINAVCIVLYGFSVYFE